MNFATDWTFGTGVNHTILSMTISQDTVTRLKSLYASPYVTGNIGVDSSFTVRCRETHVTYSIEEVDKKLTLSAIGHPTRVLIETRDVYPVFAPSTIPLYLPARILFLLLEAVPSRKVFQWERGEKDRIISGLFEVRQLSFSLLSTIFDTRMERNKTLKTVCRALDDSKIYDYKIGDTLLPVTADLTARGLTTTLTLKRLAHTNIGSLAIGPDTSDHLIRLDITVRTFVDEFFAGDRDNSVYPTVHQLERHGSLGRTSAYWAEIFLSALIKIGQVSPLSVMGLTEQSQDIFPAVALSTFDINTIYGEPRCT